MSVSCDVLQQGLQPWLPPAALVEPPEETPAGTVPAPATLPATPACKPANLLDVAVVPEHLVAVAEYLSAQSFAIDTITGVDWLAAGQMEVVYDFFHFESPVHVVVRETHEFFGIRFRGHPNLSPLLLPEDATYHPLRKDFAGAA